jgi:hypothetical protein
MALPSVVPSSPAVFGATLDPHEISDWTIPCDPMLEVGEQIASYTLTLYPEAIALGLEIMTGSGRDPALSPSGREIELWFTIDDALKTNAAFDGAGRQLPIDVFIRTTSTPYRERNATAVLPVRQK